MAARVSYGLDYYEDIRALRARGLTYEAIARRLGMSRSTVHRILQRHGRR